jgi:hypothetical protein
MRSHLGAKRATIMSLHALKHTVIIVINLLPFILIPRPKAALVSVNTIFLRVLHQVDLAEMCCCVSTRSQKAFSRPRRQKNAAQDTAPSTIEPPASKNTNTYGRITNNVAIITDTQHTSRLIPLIVHFHALVGPEWPIVFYTSEETRTQYLKSESQKAQPSSRVLSRIG